jgi:hypothetical protein
MEKTIQTSAREALALTGRLVDRFGPRIFGSATCARTADEIVTELDRHCDSVRQERFSARALFGTVPKSARWLILRDWCC